MENTSSDTLQPLNMTHLHELLNSASQRAIKIGYHYADPTALWWSHFDPQISLLMFHHSRLMDLSMASTILGH